MKTSFQKALLFTATLCALGTMVSPAVLGIDFGSQFYKISMIKPGRPFVMVENLYSKTKTYNGVTFYDKTRLFEYDARAKASRSTPNSFIFLKKYFGKNLDDENLQNLIKEHHENNNVRKGENSTIYFDLKDFTLPQSDKKDYQKSERLTEETTTLRLEEIIAMVLQHAKYISDKFGGVNFNDVVFTIPPWWTPLENEILFSSAKLAGFNPIAFVSENTAAATYMALERKKDAPEKTILFYNMGSQSTKVSVVRLDKTVNPNNNKTVDQVTLLGEGWDETLGGYAFDWCVTEEFAKNFDEKYKTDIINDPKIMRRLLKSGSKLKEILSANKQAPMIVEEVHNYKDHRVKFTREGFEEKCKKYFDRVVAPIDKALEDSGVKLEEIDDIEILGGSVRIPRVKELITEKMGKPVSMHMNGDDSMALGASFIAANSTSNFHVKKVILNHGPNYEVLVKIFDPSTLGKEDEYKKEATLFKKGQNYGGRKKLNLNYKNNIEVELTIPRGEGNQDYIVSYQINGVDKLANSEKNKDMKNHRINLGFTLDYLGLPYVHKAELLMDKEVKIEKVKEDEKKEGEEEKEEKKTRTRTISRNLEIKQLGSNGISLIGDSDAIKESVKILKQFTEYDTFLKKNSQSKNKLESLIYKMQEVVDNDDFSKFASEDEKKNLTESATELDDWMFSEEASAGNHTLYNKKFRHYNKVVKLIESRRQEDRDRPVELAEAHKQIDQFETVISSINKTRPWIKNETIAKGLEELEVHRKWLEDKIVEQSEREAHLEPVLSTTDIRMRVKSVQEIIYRLRKIRKPKKKKSKKGKKATNSTDGDFQIDDDLMEKIKKKMQEDKENKDNLTKIMEDMIKKQKEEEAAKKESDETKEEEQENKDEKTTEEEKKAEPVDL